MVLKSDTIIILIMTQMLKKLVVPFGRHRLLKKPKFLDLCHIFGQTDTQPDRQSERQKDRRTHRQA